MTEQFNDYALQKECESLAKNILADYIHHNDMQHELIDEDDNELTDSLVETIDGHEFVIYHYKALRFCAESNVDDGEAFFEEIGGTEHMSIVTLNTIASTVLYGEMQARTTRALTALVEEHNADVED